MMRHTDPGEMTSQERRGEIAHILATGYLRICRRVSQDCLAAQPRNRHSCNPVNALSKTEEVA